MRLNTLHLLNFKNYSELNIDFGRGMNCLIGNNASGKTNILDAIHYLSMCRSYFTATDYQNIKQGENFFMIKGEFEIDKKNETIVCGLKEGQKKQFKRNQKEYERLNEHIGLIPSVIVAPVDQELITEGSEGRRKFIDRIISQIDKTYLENLINYNRVLSQRNALLKQFAVSGKLDTSGLEVWDEQLLTFGTIIYKERKKFIEEFTLLFTSFYSYMTSEEESATVEYESQLDGNDFTSLLVNAFQRDRSLQFTTVGIHKDDLNFSISGQSAKKFGSQGQQKSLVIALKLAHFEAVKKHKGFRPLIMFDDLFDKLDDRRVSKILKMVHDDIFGQLFITDTHSERLKKILSDFEIPFHSFEVKNSEVMEEVQ